MKIYVNIDILNFIFLKSFFKIKLMEPNTITNFLKIMKKM